MPSLAEVLAIESDIKKRTHTLISDLHHQTQGVERQSGIHKQYTPRDEAGEAQPDEHRRVLLLHQEALASVEQALARLLDITATKDFANRVAKANVVVDGAVFMEDVPVPYLLFLEHKLHELGVFVDAMHELDAAESWSFDPASGLHRSDPVRTQRTKKVPTVIVLHPPTQQHPAQTHLHHEDQVIGTYTTTKFSGAIPGAKKRAILERLRKLEEAVKCARQQANATSVPHQHVGHRLLRYIFAAEVPSNGAP